jgi:hypothetical protein
MYGGKGVAGALENETWIVRVGKKAEHVAGLQC